MVFDLFFYCVTVKTIYTKVYHCSGSMFSQYVRNTVLSVLNSIQLNVDNMLGFCICWPLNGGLMCPRAFNTSVFERQEEKDEEFVKDWLVHQGLEKLVNVFKGMFSQF